VTGLLQRLSRRQPRQTGSNNQNFATLRNDGVRLICDSDRSPTSACGKNLTSA
jgi:hypothetical protein